LQARLRGVTRLRGRQAELARLLKVSRQVVNAWLSGAGIPNAEHTLRLLEWVEQKEAEQKTPGSATNTAKGKQTRRKDRHNELPTSGPPKK
jgi:transcriptional regulator with XRE-family HTH domain